MTNTRNRLLGLLSCTAFGAPWVAMAAGSSEPPVLGRPSAQPPAAVADWLTRYTTVAPASVVSVGDEYVVAVLSSQPMDPAHPRLLRLEIRAERPDVGAQTPDLVRSLSATLEVNCADHTSRFVAVKTYGGANLTGAYQVSQPAEGWTPDPRGSYFEDVDRAVCAPNTPRPLVLASAARPTSSIPAAVSATVLQTRPTQVSAAQTVATPQPSAAPLGIKLRPAEAPDAPPPPRLAARAAPSRAGAQAQIIAAPSPDKAEAALTALRRDFPEPMAGLTTRIERIERNGAAYYRALVYGFTPPADAASFCGRLIALGHACIPR